MIKPTPTSIVALNYDYCIKFLEQKYAFNSQDFSNKYSTTKTNLFVSDDSVPYQNFWHFIIELDSHISNGSYFYMSKDCVEGFPSTDFRSIIVNYFFNEFAEYIEDEEFLKFWVEW